MVLYELLTKVYTINLLWQEEYVALNANNNSHGTYGKIIFHGLINNNAKV